MPTEPTITYDPDTGEALVGGKPVGRQDPNPPPVQDSSTGWLTLLAVVVAAGGFAVAWWAWPERQRNPAGGTVDFRLTADHYRKGLRVEDHSVEFSKRNVSPVRAARLVGEFITSYLQSYPVPWSVTVGELKWSDYGGPGTIIYADLGKEPGDLVHIELHLDDETTEVQHKAVLEALNAGGRFPQLGGRR